MAPLGVRFHGTAEVWDSVADPDSGLVTLGVPLWSGHTSKDAADDTPYRTQEAIVNKVAHPRTHACIYIM